MRICLKVTIPVEVGNAALADGSMKGKLEATLGQLKPEAAYFLGDHGDRSMLLFVDMQDSSELPAICEPLYQQLQAKIEITPVMNLDDLMAGLAKL